MSFIMRSSLDVYMILAAICCLAVVLAYAVLGIALRRCMAFQHAFM